MKLSLRDRLLRFLKNHPGWIHGGELERKSQEAGYMASTGSRRLRDLAQAGLIERKQVNGSEMYRFKNMSWEEYWASI